MKILRRKKRDKPHIITREQDVAEALRLSGGLQTHAAESLGITQSAVSQRVKSSPFLQGIVDDVKNEMLDLCESKLIALIKESHPASIYFYLKCMGKARGWVERGELSIDATVKGGFGVLVVPGVAQSDEAWAESYKVYNDSREYIDLKPSTDRLVKGVLHHGKNNS